MSLPRRTRSIAPTQRMLDLAEVGDAMLLRNGQWVSVVAILRGPHGEGVRGCYDGEKADWGFDGVKCSPGAWPDGSDCHRLVKAKDRTDKPHCVSSAIPHFPNMPDFPDFANVYGTRIELALAGGLGAGGGLDVRHREAVGRYITQLTEYAKVIGAIRPLSDTERVHADSGR